MIQQYKTTMPKKDLAALLRTTAEAYLGVCMLLASCCQGTFVTFHHVLLLLVRFPLLFLQLLLSLHMKLMYHPTKGFVLGHQILQTQKRGACTGPLYLLTSALGLEPLIEI